MIGCREWQGRCIKDGYGVRWDKTNRRKILVHRWIWEQMHGPIPEGMVVMHLCDNPPCFRYDHLRLGTHAENMADMAGKGRWRLRGRSVLRGADHPSAKLTPEQVIDIRAAMAGGEPHRHIAERYHVARSTITAISTGQTWR